jgi:alpha-tubulin suppressor-like RCC1 family protein
LLTNTNPRINPGDKLELIHIECGGSHTVGLIKNGMVASWGDNDNGQLGVNDWEKRSVPTTVETLDGSVITKISCGGYHTAALTKKGELFTWYVQS